MYRKPLQTSTYGLAIFNLLSAFIYSLAVADKLHLEGGIRIGVRIAVIVLFFVMELIPKVVLVPAIAAGFMNIFCVWSLLAHIGSNPIRITLKVVSLIIFVLLELALFTDVTLGSKEDTHIPTLSQLKAQGYEKRVTNGVTSYQKVEK